MAIVNDLILGKKNNFRETTIFLAFSHKKDAIKQILKINCLYVVSTLIWRLNVKLLQYKSIFKNCNVRWD